MGIRRKLIIANGANDEESRFQEDIVTDLSHCNFDTGDLFGTDRKRWMHMDVRVFVLAPLEGNLYARVRG